MARVNTDYLRDSAGNFPLRNPYLPAGGPMAPNDRGEQEQRILALAAQRLPITEESRPLPDAPRALPEAGGTPVPHDREAEQMALLEAARGDYNRNALLAGISGAGSNFYQALFPNMKASKNPELLMRTGERGLANAAQDVETMQAEAARQKKLQEDRALNKFLTGRFGEGFPEGLGQEALQNIYQGESVRERAKASTEQAGRALTSAEERARLTRELTMSESEKNRRARLEVAQLRGKKGSGGGVGQTVTGAPDRVSARTQLVKDMTDSGVPAETAEAAVPATRKEFGEFQKAEGGRLRTQAGQEAAAAATDLRRAEEELAGIRQELATPLQAAQRALASIDDFARTKPESGVMTNLMRGRTSQSLTPLGDIAATAQSMVGGIPYVGKALAGIPEAAAQYERANLLSPEEQALSRQLTAVESAFGRLISGQAVSEGEANRIRKILEGTAGASLQQRRDALQEVIDLLKAKENSATQRVKDLQERGGASRYQRPGTTPAPSPTRGPQPVVSKDDEWEDHAGPR